MIQRGGADGPVKIGVSISVNTRLRSLQNAAPEPLEVIRMLEGGKGVEAWLHRYFSSRCISGEWFSFDPEMLTISPVVEEKASGAPAEHGEVNEIIVRHYGAFSNRRRRLAADAHSTERTAENWLQGRCEPQASRLKNIARNNPAFRADLIAWLESKSA